MPPRDPVRLLRRIGPLLSILALVVLGAGTAHAADAPPAAPAAPAPEAAPVTDGASTGQEAPPSAAAPTQAEPAPSAEPAPPPAAVPAPAPAIAPSERVAEPVPAEAAGAPAPPAPPVVPITTAPPAIEPAPAPTGLAVRLRGGYRLLLPVQTDLPLGLDRPDGAQRMLGRTFFPEHRLRLGAKATRGKVSFDFELEVLNGLLSTPQGGPLLAPVAGASADTDRPLLADPLRNERYGLDLNSMVLRKALLAWQTPAGQLQVGVTTFSWGQGMLSNAGDEPMDSQLADPRFGDRTARALFATRPLSLVTGGRSREDFTLALGADFLLQDATARFWRPDAVGGPRARQDTGASGLVALRHARGGYSAGLLAVRKQIWFAPTAVAGPAAASFVPDLGVWAFDFTLDWRRSRATGREVALAFEGALVSGSTTYVRNLSCPGDSRESRCALLQGGALVRARMRRDPVSLELLGGFASGDGNPFDATSTSFSFNRNFRAGLLLFDQVLAWNSAASVRRATDPNMANVPTAGVALLSTNGAITNALFVQPTARWRIARHTTLTGAVLVAGAPAGFVDALWTNQRSARTNPWLQPARSFYGVELDFGADYRRPLGAGVELLAGLAGACFLPGDAFVVDAVGHRMDTAYLGKLRLGLEF